MVSLRETIERGEIRYNRLELIIKNRWARKGEIWKLAKKNKLRGYEEYKVLGIEDFPDLALTKIVLEERDGTR